MLHALRPLSLPTGCSLWSLPSSNFLLCLINSCHSFFVPGATSSRKPPWPCRLVQMPLLTASTASRWVRWDILFYLASVSSRRLSIPWRERPSQDPQFLVSTGLSVTVCGPNEQWMNIRLGIAHGMGKTENNMCIKLSRLQSIFHIYILFDLPNLAGQMVLFLTLFSAEEAMIQNE